MSLYHHGSGLARKLYATQAKGEIVQPLSTGEPRQVGDYRLLARIGKGAMGAVYLGRSRGGRPVAVKVVRPDLAEDPEFRERFRREARMSAAVGGFWTATVVDADPEAEQPWLATEYVAGPTLQQAVAEHGPLPVETVRQLAAGLAEALQAVHRAGLVHRDLKPANVLLGTDGPRVIDFGISRAVAGAGITATGMFFGTPGYFSPEQTSGQEVGPASDVFSLGAVLAFAATGNAPFGNENSAAMLYRVVHNEPDLTRLPPGIRPLVADCLTKNPEQRPTTGLLLDRLGDSGPRSHEWLPAGVTALVSAHDTRLREVLGHQRSDEAYHLGAAHRPLDGSGGVVHRPRAHPTAVESAAAQAPSAESRPPTARPGPPAAPDSRGPDSRGPDSQGPDSREPRRRPAVRPDLPGPVFRTGGRFGSLVSCVVALALAVATHRFAVRIDPGEAAWLVGLGVMLLLLSSLLSAIQVLLPGPRLKINGDGVRVSRFGMCKEIPWQRIARVGLVGSGKKQALAVWPCNGAAAPPSTWWHRVRGYHGGGRIFTVGACGGWMKRRREARRLRAALEQYSAGRYDARLL